MHGRFAEPVLRRVVELGALRRQLRDWILRSRWTHAQVARAVQMYNSTSACTAAIGSLLSDDPSPLARKNAAAVAAFLAANPAPGPFDDWLGERARAALALSKYDRIRAEAEAVEQARAARRDALLAAERAPRRRPRREFLDSATIHALSGGTLRSLRG
jgi:hypothetical protein